MKKLIPFLLITIALTGCATFRGGSCPAYGDVSPVTGWSHSDGESGGLLAGSGEAEERRVVVYNSSVRLMAKNTDSLNANLSRIAAKYKGYILSLGSDRSVIRLKAELLNPATADICSLGKVLDKTVSGEDVTQDYRDSHIRLDNCQKARLRYLELLAKAENVEAALKVERELERLNREIDVLEGKIKRLDHLSEYSTITVYMERRLQKPGVLGYLGIGIYKGIKWLFVRG